MRTLDQHIYGLTPEQRVKVTKRILKLLFQENMKRKKKDLLEEIERREVGRISLIHALQDIANSKNHQEAVKRAKEQLAAAGVLTKRICS